GIRLPFRVVHFHPELVPALLQEEDAAVECKTDVVEVAENSTLRCYLRHRSMVSPPPAFILARMTALAFIRGNVTVRSALPGDGFEEGLRRFGLSRRPRAPNHS